MICYEIIALYKATHKIKITMFMCFGQHATIITYFFGKGVGIYNQRLGTAVLIAIYPGIYQCRLLGVTIIRLLQFFRR